MDKANLFDHPSTARTVFLLSLFELFYFGLIALLFESQVDLIMVRVFGELLTIPMLLLLLILILISVILLVKSKFRLHSFPFFSLVILAATVILVLH